MKRSSVVLLNGVIMILLLSGCRHRPDLATLNARAACAAVAEDGSLLPSNITTVTNAASRGHPDVGVIAEFYDAVRIGDLGTVRRLVAQDSRLLSERDPLKGATVGKTPLYVAIDVGSLETVKLLIDSGGDVKERSSLCRAAILMDADGMRSLNAALARLSADATGQQTPFRANADKPIRQLLGEVKAIIERQKLGVEKRLEILRYLLEQGADPNALDPITKTPPLVFAAYFSSDSRGVDVLLNHGAKPGDCDASGFTALRAAVVTGNIGAARVLAARPAVLDAANHLGETVLMAAAQYADPAMIRMLLDNGAGILKRDNRGWNSLFYAVYGGNEDAFRVLFARGAFREDLVAREQSVLNLACLKGSVAIVDAVLACDVDLETTDSDGYTPLLSATENGHLEIVEKLLARGANHKARMGNGASALNLAASSGSLELVRLFVSLGLDVNDAVSGGTPLCGAALYGRLDIVSFLLEKGAKAEPETRRTPLMMVAMGPKELNRRNNTVQTEFPGLPPGTEDEYVAVAELLLANGANVHARTPDGGTPVSWAKASGFQRMADLLASKGMVTTEREPRLPVRLSDTGRAGNGRIDEEELSSGTGIETRDKQGYASPGQAATSDDPVDVANRQLITEEKELGPDNPEIAACLCRLADAYAAQGQNPLAATLYRRALSIREKARGPDHAEFAEVLEKLAAVYRKIGFWEKEAEALEKRAAAIRAAKQ